LQTNRKKDKIDKVKKQKLILRQKKTQIVNNEADVEVQNEAIIDSEDNDDNSVCSNSSKDKNQVYNKPVNEKKKDDWVLVKFSKNKSIYYYVGQVIDNKEDCTVKFLRKLKSKKKDCIKFVWPTIDDVGMVLEPDIMVILPEPSKGRRGKLLFPVDFSSYNVQ